MIARKTALLLATTLLASTLTAARAADDPPGGAILLVVNRDGNELVIVDPAARKVLGRVPVGTAPHEVAASADWKLAFVANYGTGQDPGRSLSIIDIAGRKELRRVDLGALRRPHGLAVVEGKVYFTAEMNRVLGRLDPEAGAVDRIAGLGQDVTHMVAASPDNTTLYTANMGSDTVSALDRRTGKLTHVPVTRQPEGLAVRPDGREVWAGSRSKGEVSVIDAASLKVVATLDVGRPAYRVRFTPDGKQALIPDPEGGKLVVVGVESRKVEREVEVGPGPIGVVTDPEGRRAFVSLASGGKIVVVDLVKLAQDGTIDVGQASDGMAYVGPRS